LTSKGYHLELLNNTKSQLKSTLTSIKFNRSLLLDALLTPTEGPGLHPLCTGIVAVRAALASHAKMSQARQEELSLQLA